MVLTESSVLDRALVAVESDSGVGHVLTSKREHLQALTQLFNDLPSIRQERSLGAETQSLDTLVDTILQNGPALSIVMPTKVAVGRALLVYRFNLIGYLVKVARGHGSLGGLRRELQREWESTMFLLLLEELYHAVLDGTVAYSNELRRRAVVELVHLWECRSWTHVAVCAAAVVEMWRVRRQIAPVFGTMVGNIELLRLSTLLSDDWHDFLERHGDDIEATQAIQEFVFGVVHENLERGRTVMQERGLAVVDRDTLASFLDPSEAPTEMTGPDPRELYRFFTVRTAANARRIAANAPGPRRTLEELVLVHFLSQSPHRCGSDENGMMR